MELKFKWFMAKWLYMGYCLEKDNSIFKIKVIIHIIIVYAYDKTNHIFS